MLLDNSLLLEDEEQTATTSAASTDYIDTLAAGEAVEGAWIVFKVGATAFTAQVGAPTVVFQLQTDSASTFGSDGSTTAITLCASSAALVAALTASTVMYKARIPAGVKRYIRAYKSVSNYSAGTIALAGGTWQAFIVKDVDINEIAGG
jgi:hypothetical protein